MLFTKKENGKQWKWNTMIVIIRFRIKIIFYWQAGELQLAVCGHQAPLGHCFQYPE